MSRPAMLTATALALGALGAAPAEAAARLPLAPETTLAAAERSATGPRSGAARVVSGAQALEEPGRVRGWPRHAGGI
jgi:hypothetical protein